MKRALIITRYVADTILFFSVTVPISLSWIVSMTNTGVEAVMKFFFPAFVFISAVFPVIVALALYSFIYRVIQYAGGFRPRTAVEWVYEVLTWFLFAMMLYFSIVAGEEGINWNLLGILTGAIGISYVLYRVIRYRRFL